MTWCREAASQMLPEPILTKVICRHMASIGPMKLICLKVKSLKLIWRSGACRIHLRVPDFQMSCRDLTTGTGFFDCHDDVIKWRHFPRCWPFVRGIHRSPVNFPHKGQWRGALMFSLICAGINAWVNNREAGDLRRHQAHYDVIVMNGILLNWGISVYTTPAWHCLCCTDCGKWSTIA